MKQKRKPESLDRIRRAYDRAVEQYERGEDPLASVPDEFKKSKEFAEFVKGCRNCNTGDGQIKKFLNPQKGMKFLDAGCGAGLLTYDLYQWPSLYHGVDISPKTIMAMQGVAVSREIEIGGLYVSELSNLPFPDNHFDIAACIGVLEYHELPYVKTALRELHRTLRSCARIVIDIPNRSHHHHRLMSKLEVYQGRPHGEFTRREFEENLHPYFSIQTVDDSQVMLRYYLLTRDR